MTIEGAIAQLQELIDNDGIPFWAKPSLQKVMETVEAEREQHIKERNTGRWNDDGTCSFCGTYSSLNLSKVKYCPECGAKMEGAEE